MYRHRMLRVSFYVMGAGLLTWICCVPSASAKSSATAFRPISPAELQMMVEPAAPGAPAVILEREVFVDDNAGHEDTYFRIKILTEEGRKYADIEIPFIQDAQKVSDIHVRTVKPDGTIVDFAGQFFTKTLVKANGIRVQAKTLTLRDVQVGSVIEYFYSVSYFSSYFYFLPPDSHWIISHELFTKAAKFSFVPTGGYAFSAVWHNMPLNTLSPKADRNHIIRLEVSNIPAFQTEDFMPPEDEMKTRVDFVYSWDATEKDPSKFWTKVGEREDYALEKFVEKPAAMKKAVSEIIGTNDSPETKLEKIYARVQQMRNTQYEVSKTEQEEQREKIKEANTAEDVWKHGYGDGRELTWLFLALARAAGFEAYDVMAADRENYFFNPRLMQAGNLDYNIVLVKLNGKDIFCRPGSPFTPYGLLPWELTGIPGLKLDKKDSSWIAVMSPTPAQARTERRATLTLSPSGDLEGRLTVAYTGLEADRVRTEERNEDETGRKKYLEDEAKGFIPTPSEVKLVNQPDWKNPATPLEAELEVRVPGWGAAAGRHVIFPVGLLAAHEKHVFDHAARVHPVYFKYPFVNADDITIQVPSGWKVSGLPPTCNYTSEPVAYTLSAQNDGSVIHLSRKFTVEFILMEARYYPALRNFFQKIKSGDDQQIVLEPVAPTASN